MRLRIDELASLWAESPTAPVQVSLLLTLEPVGPDPLTAERLVALLVTRAERLPALHRRIRCQGPSRAEWVPDPSPAADRILLDDILLDDADRAAWSWAADRAVRPLPADRPPWRVLVARAGQGGGPVVLITAHHALVDGAQGLDLVRSLFGDPEQAAGPEPEPGSATGPGPGSLRPVAPPTSPVARRRRLRARTASAGCVLAALTALRGREPGAGLPRAAGTGRRLDVVRRPLEPVHRAARALDVTITDVVLGALASALRDLCETRGSLRPGLTLRASVPIAQPGGGQASGLMVAPLPVGEPDPARRLAGVAAATARVRALVRRSREAAAPARQPPAAVPARRPPIAARPLLALARFGMVRSRAWGESRVTAAVTSLRGPAGGWLLPGARITGVVPLAPLSDRVRICVTAVTYAGELCIAVHTGADVDPSGVLGPATGRALDQMVARAGEAPPRPARRPAGPASAPGVPGRDHR